MANPEVKIVPGQILFSTEQGAALLGISARFLRVFIDNGTIKARRIGARLLIHKRELEKFASRDHSTKGEAAPQL